MTKHHAKPIALIISVFTLSLTIGYLALAWTEPTLAPPGDNVAAPINVGAIGQSKAGGLILNTGGADDGLLVYGTSSFAGPISVGGSIGAAGQVLKSQGPGVSTVWGDAGGGLGYISSQSFSASNSAGNSSTNVSMPENAEMAVINAYFNSWTNLTWVGNNRTQFIIYRNGVSSAGTWTSWGTGSGSPMTQKLDASLSGNTITLTVTNGNGTSLSGTAYFYR